MAQQVGAPPDAHGCLPSAGYDYSVVKGTCIQMWEAGIKLLPLQPQGTATFAAYVVFASGHDGHRAEVFLYDRKGSLILEKTGLWNHTWKAQDYVLRLEKGIYKLYGPDGRMIYSGSAR